MPIKGVEEISGSSLPKIGEPAVYSVTQWYEETPIEDRVGDKVQWELFRKRSDGQFTTTNIIKQGLTAEFLFKDGAFRREYRLIAYLYRAEMDGRSWVAIQPQRGKPVFEKLSFLNSRKKPFAETPKYGQTVFAKIETCNMQTDELVIQIFSQPHQQGKVNTLLFEHTVKVPTDGTPIQLSIPLMKLKANKTLGGSIRHFADEDVYYITVLHHRNKNGIEQLLPVKQATLHVKGFGWDQPIKEGVSPQVVEVRETKNREKEKVDHKFGNCYCKEMGIVKMACANNVIVKGISNEAYESYAQKIGCEKEVIMAIAKKESAGEPFIKDDTHAKILYERHKAYKSLKAKGKTPEEMNKYEEIKDPNGLPIIYPTQYDKDKHEYGSYPQQIQKLDIVKKIDNDIAIESCSWGRFQVMGNNYKGLYTSPSELEDAQNHCEIQHLVLFFQEVKNNKSLINAMVKKDWEHIALYYNGAKYKKNNYDKDIKNTMRNLKNNLKCWSINVMNIILAWMVLACFCSCNANSIHNENKIINNVAFQKNDSNYLAIIKNILHISDKSDVSILDSAFIANKNIFEIAVFNLLDSNKTFHFFIFKYDSLLVYSNKLLGSGLDCGRDECMVNIDNKTNEIFVGGRDGITFHISELNHSFYIDTVISSFKTLNKSNKYIVSRIFNKQVNLSINSVSLEQLYNLVMPGNVDYYDSLFESKYNRIKQQVSQNDYSSLDGYKLDSLKTDINQQGIYEKRINQYYDIASWLIKAGKQDAAKSMINFFYNELEEVDKKRGEQILASINSSSSNVVNQGITSQNVAKYNEQAYQLQQQGKNKEAVDILEKIIQVAPDRVVAYLNLADAYWGLNKKEEAKQNYQKYVDLMKEQKKDLSRIPKRVYERIK